MSVLQLRDELTQRGLARIGNKNEMIQRIQDDDQKKEAQIEIINKEKQRIQELKEEEEDTQNHLLNGLTKEFMIKEILRRRPHEKVEITLSKKKLYGLISKTLEDEHPDISKTKNMVGIYEKIINKSTKVTVSEICTVLENISTIFQIPQSDINFLRFSESSSLEGMWQIIFSNLNQMDSKQLYIVTKSLYVLQNYFYKSFKPGHKTIDKESLLSLLKQIIKTSKDYKPYQLANVAEIVSKLSTEPEIENILNQIRNDAISSLEDISSYSSKQLLTLLDSFPVNAYKKHKEKIDKIIVQLYKSSQKTPFDRSLKTLTTLDLIGAPIPKNLLFELDSIPKGYLWKIAPTYYLNIAKILAQQDILSEVFGKTIIEILSHQDLIDSNGIRLYADFVYVLNTRKIFPQLISKTSLLKQCLENEERIDLISALKLSVVYLPHIKSEIIADVLSREISKLSYNDPI